MSKFNHYAVDFNTAFKEFRTTYCEAFNKLESARTAEKNASGEVAKLTTRAARIEAENKFKNVAETSLTKFKRTRDELTAALKAEVEAACVADPAALDRDACYLLDSGMLKPSDYVNFAKKFSGNVTMLRVIGAKAEAAAQTAEPEDRAVLNSVRNSCKGAGREPLEAWNALVETSRYCTGNRYDGDRSTPEHVVTMAEKWESLTAGTVEAF